MSVFDKEGVFSQPWEFYGASAYPLYISIYPPTYARGFLDRYGFGVNILNTYHGNRVHWFMRADQLVALAKAVLPMLGERQWDYYGEYEKDASEFVSVHRTFLTTDLASLGDEALVDLMRRYRYPFEKQIITNNINEPLSYYFQLELKNLLAQEGMDAVRAEELMHEYGQAARPSYLKLAAEAWRNAHTVSARAHVLAEFEHIFNSYVGPKPPTERDMQELADTTPLEFASEKKTPGLSPRAQMLLNVLMIIATIQDVRKGELLQMVTAASRFADEWSRRKGIGRNSMNYALWSEMEDGTLDPEALERRKDAFVIHWGADEGVESVAGDEARPIADAIDKYIFFTDESAGEVKGICASKGSAKGRAVIIFDPSEFARVQEGDILFTVMTRPEFLPVMHKAAAFICDEGGLTSHAAIVAREMKKPCIVGTKVGSRIFKEGDMVEVDADRGIVKKL